VRGVRGEGYVDQKQNSARLNESHFPENHLRGVRGESGEGYVDQK
jgi:hypothetical protein